MSIGTTAASPDDDDDDDDDDEDDEDDEDDDDDDEDGIVGNTPVAVVLPSPAAVASAPTRRPAALLSLELSEESGGCFDEKA